VRHHHAGSGRRTVIPAGWAATHAPVAAGFMTEATISLRKPGGTGTHFDDTAGRTVATAIPAFATGVPARILALTESSVPPQDAVEDQVRVLGYRISVPRDTTTTGLHEGDLVTVTACPGDPMLVAAEFKVTDIVRGTHRFQRDLICDLNT
jgi:hypothetical protein